MSSLENYKNNSDKLDEILKSLASLQDTTKTIIDTNGNAISSFQVLQAVTTYDTTTASLTFSPQQEGMFFLIVMATWGANSGDANNFSPSFSITSTNKTTVPLFNGNLRNFWGTISATKNVPMAMNAWHGRVGESAYLTVSSPITSYGTNICMVIGKYL